MKKILKEFLISAALFFCIFYVTLQVDWMKLFHLQPTIVGDKLSEWVWKESVRIGGSPYDSEKK